MTTKNIGKLCGFRAGDVRAANAKAGYSTTPSGYTWHHDLNNMGDMVLVKTTTHATCGHVGSAAVWGRMFGYIGSYPTSLPPLYP